MSRAPWLEPHDQFEGVGAHEFNPRYEPVDEDGFDEWEVELRTLALFAARQSLLAAVKPRLDGIDVSHHNIDAGPLLWDVVAGIPTFWGACKLTQSTKYLDPTAAFNRRGMATSGLRHRGLYHWISSTTDVGAQARWFLDRLGSLADGEFAMLDAEEYSTESAAAMLGRCVRWCELVEAATRRPCVVYTGAYVASGSLWQSPVLRTSKYGPRPFILAAYTTEAKARALPGVKAHPWQSWQWSSNGPVAGVTGRCDTNRVDDQPAYDVACGLVDHDTPPEQIPPVQPPQPPPSVPPLSPEEDDMKFIMRRLSDGATWLVWLQGGRWQAAGLGGTGGFDPDDAALAIANDVAPLWPVSDERADWWLAKVKADARLADSPTA